MSRKVMGGGCIWIITSALGPFAQKQNAKFLFRVSQGQGQAKELDNIFGKRRIDTSNQKLIELKFIL